MRFLRQLSTVGMLITVVIIPLVLLEGFVTGSLSAKGGPIDAKLAPREFWIWSTMYIAFLVLAILGLFAQVSSSMRQQGTKHRDFASFASTLKRLLRNEFT